MNSTVIDTPTLTALNSQVRNRPNWGRPIPIHIMDRGNPNFSLILPSSLSYGFAVFFQKFLDLVEVLLSAKKKN